jgi:putative aminopeptidase FrvX
MALVDLIRELSAIFGPSGYEQPIAEHVLAMLQTTADDTTIDTFGNVVGTFYGEHSALPRLLILAHLDTVGALVVDIEDHGLLRVAPQGLVSAQALCGARLRVNGQVPATVALAPGHLASPTAPSWDALRVDVGAGRRSAVRALGIQVGDAMTFDGAFHLLPSSHILLSPALDDRTGCAALLWAFQDRRRPRMTVHLGFSVQEEIGMRGARMIAERVKPDWAIIVDTVPETHTVPDQPASFRLGDGPVIQVAEGVQSAYVGTMHHPAVRRHLEAVAQSQSCPLQYSARTRAWTTDGAAVMLANQGIPTGFLSIPRRNAHSANEMVALSDVEQLAALLQAVAHADPPAGLKARQWSRT